MEQQRFDGITRLVAASGSRRRALKAIAGAFVGGFIGRKEASAQQCTPHYTPCTIDSQCCSGAVCQWGLCMPGCRIEGVFANAWTGPAGNICATCRPEISTTSWTPANEGVGCWNGNLCGGTSSCRNGVCASTSSANNCQPLTPCHLKGECQPSTGLCSNPPAPAGTSCGGSASCVGDFFNPGLTCDGNGFCSGGQTVSCAPYRCGVNACKTTCGSDADCVEAAHCDDGVCLYDLALGEACDEDSDCRSGICAQGVCCSTRCDSLCDVCSAATGGICQPKNCNDNIACTTDSCNPATGVCEHVIQANRCLIDGVCRLPQVAHPQNPCLACLPGVSQTAWSPLAAGTSCSDGNPCTGPDLCDGAGVCNSALLPPVISCPPSRSLSTATGTCGAIATFSASASCGSVQCSHLSGATFPLGETPVQCMASNAAGTDTCTFTITVEDREDPSITCPGSSMHSGPNWPTGSIYHYSVGATDNCDTNLDIECSHPSGSHFPLGTTTVTCSATDDTGRSDSCEFDVTIECLPICTNKACGESDGCGGTCVGPCPDPGPCKTATCDATTKVCQISNASPGASCGTFCRQGATCDASGNCAGGVEPSCEQTSSLCHARFGTCDDAQGGCVYQQFSPGTTCSSSSNLCQQHRCNAAAQCVTSTTTCSDSECQYCDPGDGICKSYPPFTVCGNGLKLCADGVCQSPCGEECVNYCFAEVDPGGTPSPAGPFSCCPPEARLGEGGCCWRRNQFGIVIDGVCYDKRQVCANGQGCWTECCGASDQGYAGVCPGTNDFCVNVGGSLVLRSNNTACTVDGDCTTQYGSGAACSNVSFSTPGPEGPQPVPNSGTCCPVGYQGPPNFQSFPPTPTCCPPGTRVYGGQGACCSFPAYISACSDTCTCSFKNISRCCF